MLVQGRRRLAVQQDALAFDAAARPVLILVDIQLPGLDGLEMTRRLKRDPATSNICIIAVTAFASPLVERNAYDAGCDDFVAKPIDTRTLGALVKAALSRVPCHG